MYDGARRRKASINSEQLQRESKMNRYILDLEADGLLDTVSKVFVIVIKNIDSGERWVLTGDKEIKEGLARVQDQHLIGHNLIG